MTHLVAPKSPLFKGRISIFRFKNLHFSWKCTSQPNAASIIGSSASAHAVSIPASNHPQLSHTILRNSPAILKVYSPPSASNSGGVLPICIKFIIFNENSIICNAKSVIVHSEFINSLCTILNAQFINIKMEIATNTVRRN